MICATFYPAYFQEQKYVKTAQGQGTPKTSMNIDKTDRFIFQLIPCDKNTIDQKSDPRVCVN